MAMKLAANAIAGLLTPLIEEKPLKKYFKSIINRPEIGVQHRDYLKAHLPYQLLQFALIPKHNQCQQTLNLFLRSALRE